jgi:hypothetical protein
MRIQKSINVQKNINVHKSINVQKNINTQKNTRGAHYTVKKPNTCKNKTQTPTPAQFFCVTNKSYYYKTQTPTPAQLCQE